MGVQVRLLLIGILAVMVFPMYASAASSNVVGGQLMGATGVDVGGTLYDVAFLDGSCIGLFAGCDETSDFVFNSQADAYSASTALLEQVLLDGPYGDFDSEYGLVNGISAIAGAWPFRIATAYDLTDMGTHIRVQLALADNYPGFGSDDVTYNWTHQDADSGHEFAGNWVYAVWGTSQSVPEPSTLLLLGSGLAGLGFVRRKFKG
jgi:hypothetical protein